MTEKATNLSPNKLKGGQAAGEAVSYHHQSNKEGKEDAVEDVRERPASAIQQTECQLHTPNPNSIERKGGKSREGTHSQRSGADGAMIPKYAMEKYTMNTQATSCAGWKAPCHPLIFRPIVEIIFNFALEISLYHNGVSMVVRWWCLKGFNGLARQ
jgi:hypothetical protein